MSLVGFLPRLLVVLNTSEHPFTDMVMTELLQNYFAELRIGGEKLSPNDTCLLPRSASCQPNNHSSGPLMPVIFESTNRILNNGNPLILTKMKTLKTLTAAILIILSASAFAIDKKKNEKLLMDYTVKKYIEAVSLGQLKGVANIFDNEVKMTMTVHNRVVNYGKSEIMTLLKFAENTEQNCKTEYRMLERTPSNALAKVTMKYDGFSKINFISMANTTDGWKITSITTSID